ncbi:MAG: hypothetical protein Q7R49_01475 [Candidatus Daviesbacteria bacterium]|nr:hypothetical protein [Candidatus Daviesbacteria bacterium]
MAEQLRPSVAEIKSALENNQHVRLVGELKVLNLTGYNYNLPGVREDFYVEPINPPVFSELTDSQVDALNAAAYYKRQPTRELTAIPRQFSDLYNQILHEMLPVEQFEGFVSPFGFVSNLAASRVYLGERHFNAIDTAGTVATKIERNYLDPKLQEQSAMLGQPPVQESNVEMGVDIHVRLFPPAMGKLVHEYETGYYLNGNVVQWDQSENNNLVYKGRYIDMEQLSPEQLQALARGEFPFPKIEYLEKSVFAGDPDEVQQIISHRLTRRSIVLAEFRPGGILGRSPEKPAGDFDETSYDPEKFRTGDPSAIHTH